MKYIDYLSYLVTEIHTVIVATVDDDGLPVTAAIDMMDYDETGVYFLTAKGKGFYERLKKHGVLALTGINGLISPESRLSVPVLPSAGLTKYRKGI